MRFRGVGGGLLLLGVGGGAVEGGDGVVGGGDFVADGGAVGLAFEGGGSAVWVGNVSGLGER